MTFRISLETYRGPLELLLFLVRKHEVDVLDIPVSQVTEQFLEYLEVLRDLQVDDVADFVEVASTLLEIKSRLALPSNVDDDEPVEVSRDELVQRLLEYKRFKDAASLLEEQSRQWQQHYPRLANDLPPRDTDFGSQPIAEVELWDLVSAFGRIIREKVVARQESIAYDGTPIHVHMQRIHDLLTQDGRAAFTEMFETRMHKSTMIGVFLAILELVRHHSVRAEQTDPYGEIWILPGEKFDSGGSFQLVDDYEPKSLAESELQYKPR
jgi:segregation and condensation protein A